MKTLGVDLHILQRSDTETHNSLHLTSNTISTQHRVYIFCFTVIVVLLDYATLFGVVGFVIWCFCLFFFHYCFVKDVNFRTVLTLIYCF